MKNSLEFDFSIDQKNKLYQLAKPLAIPVASLAVWLALNGCQEATPPATAAAVPNAVSVEVERVQFREQGEASQPVFSGNLEAYKTTPLHFMVPGRVANLLVKEGDYVSKGAVLAELESEELSYALEIAEANLAQAQDAFRRFDEMYQKGNLAEKDIVDARTRLKLAEIQVKQQRKTLREARLLTPEAGILTQQRIEEGGMASPEMPVFSLVTVSPLYAKFAIPETQIAQVQKGQRFWVTVPALGKTFEGTVAIISPVADNMTRTYPVKVVFANEGQTALPGMIAQGRPDFSVEAPADSVLTVRPFAVMKDAQERSFVYVVDPSNKVAVKKMVEVGRVLGDHVEIVKGLAANEQVITGGNQKIKEGQAVAF